MDTKEIKEAVDLYKDRPSGILFMRLVELGQAYLTALESLPARAYDPTLVCQPDYPDDYTKGKVKGFNDCHDLLTPHITQLQGRVRQLEELIEKIKALDRLANLDLPQLSQVKPVTEEMIYKLLDKWNVPVDLGFRYKLSHAIFTLINKGE